MVVLLILIHIFARFFKRRWSMGQCPVKRRYFFRPLRPLPLTVGRAPVLEVFSPRWGAFLRFCGVLPRFLSPLRLLPLR
jgi:hypothetical protein